MINQLWMNPADGIGEGNFTSMNLKIDFMLEPTDDGGTNTDMPTHRVLVKGDFGTVEAGGCWTKKVGEGANRGATFFSLTVDDPSFSAPVNFAAFKNAHHKPDEPKGKQLFDVVWRRPRKQG